MKFTLSWLKDHLDTNKDIDTIVDTLTNIGLDIENVEDKSKEFNDFTVAEVLKAEKHPDADRLKVCTVKSIDGIFQVVCGAPNAREGMKGIFAPENSFIPGTGVKLKKSKIRGIESCGMLVSEREMGISDEHDGIIEVDSKYALGEKFIEVFNLDDPVIETFLIVSEAINCCAILGGSPDKRFTTPGGTPHSLQISTISITTPGVITSGLIITEHPAAIAVEIFLADNTAGKFQGDNAATTPTGW